MVRVKREKVAEEVCYRVCTSVGMCRYDSLKELETYLADQVAREACFFPIKRIVRVSSLEIPLPSFVGRYNSEVEKQKKKRGRKHG